MPDPIAAADPLAAVLPLYCSWLNSALTFADDTRTTPDQFDPAINEYASVKRGVTYRVEDYVVSVWSVYDGDEGGPAYLTVYFTLDGQPWHATQNFDTYLTVWLTDGKIVPAAS